MNKGLGALHVLGWVLHGDGEGAMATHAVAHNTRPRQVQLVRELSRKQGRQLLQMPSEEEARRYVGLTPWYRVRDQQQAGQSLHK